VTPLGGAGGYFDEAVDGVAILLWACDPDQPERLATPFFVAAAAAALELPVEVYFTARSVHLLVPGVADGLRGGQSSPKSIRDAMHEASAQGARFFACTDALRAQGLDGRVLIGECRGHGGALQFAARAGDRRWRALVF
jgi:uncharacterized protein